MAEIKSTLDLVMEKTRHLRISAEERREQQEKEGRARIRGLIAKLTDRVLDGERFVAAYRQLQADCGLADDAALIAECLAQLSIDGDNHAVLNAMQAATGLDLDAIGVVIEQIQERRQEISAIARERLAAALAADHGIAGSAVVPNPAPDEEWQRAVADLEGAFQRRLSELNDKLVPPR